MRFSFLLLALSFCVSVTAQDMVYFYVESTGFTVTQQDIQEANTLEEIHHRYEGESVRSYIDTEIQYTKNGYTTSAKGKSNALTPQQKELLRHAQVSGKLKISVNYMPENTLSSNTPKNMDLYLEIIPQKSAQYKTGKEEFEDFIATNIVASLDPSEKEALTFASIDFTISKEGKVENVKLEEGSGNMEIDAKLQESFCKFGDWTPAETLDGQPVDHSLRFYISNSMGNCLAYRGISKK